MYVLAARAFVVLVDPKVGQFLPGVDEEGDGHLNVRALSQVCPHLGCRPNPCIEDFWFHCPCHQSRYHRPGRGLSAMNVNMWNHPATQANLEILRKRGVKIVEPDSGYLACGMIGPGRLASNEVIVAAVLQALGAAQDLAGETILITAGPTREKIDPVRYITNRSSGRMGYALAELPCVAVLTCT